MTSETVESLLNMELMANGVLKPVAPKLVEIPESPLGERVKYFGVSTKSKYGSSESFGLAFRTMEDAVAFTRLNPLKAEYDYEVGYDFKYASPQIDFTVDVVELYALDQINAFRSQLKKRNADSENNKKLQEEFVQASQKAEKITERVWEDWHKQHNLKVELARVISTFEEYKNMTGGDAWLAYGFLKKAFKQEQIDEARIWFPDSAIPTDATAIAEPIPTEPSKESNPQPKEK